MTNKKAVEKLREEFCKLKAFCELYPDTCRKEECEIHMSIKALEGKDTNVTSKDTVSKASVCEILADIYPTDGEKVVAVKEVDKAYEAIQQLPFAQPERVWTPCDIPPEHHRDVIVRGIEAIGNVTVHNIMQWDVDRWRPENYAPSIIWLDWSEI